MVMMTAVRRRAVLVLMVASTGVATACGASGAPTGTAAPVARSAPCPAGEPVRAVATTGEHLRPTWLPPGFALRDGTEAPPSTILEYFRTGPGDQPRITLARYLTTEPAASRLDVGRTEPVTVRGRDGLIGGTQMPAPALQFLFVGWHEQPGVVLVVGGNGVTRADLLHVAGALDYGLGPPGPAVTGPARRPPARCGVLPPGALTRHEVLARFPARPGITVAAKLARLSDLDRSEPQTDACEHSPCPDGLVRWVVLQTGPPGSFPHSCPPSASPTACAGSFELSVADAASGVSNGFEIGNGTAPPWWDELDDIDPASS
jgi:hypothetical protein